MILFAGCSGLEVMPPVPDKPLPVPRKIYDSDFEIIDFVFAGKDAIIVDNGIKFLSPSGVNDISFNISAIPSQVYAMRHLNDKFYLCTLNGLFELDPARRHIEGYFSSNQCLSSDRVNDICGNDEILFIATDNGLTIHTLDPTLNIQYEKYRGLRTVENWFSLDTENSLMSSSNCLRCIMAEDVLCVVTDNDVIIYNTDLDIVENYPISDYLDDFEITDLVSRGPVLFFSTYNGIYSYDISMQSWEKYEAGGMVDDSRLISITANGGKLFALTPTQVISFDPFSKTYDLILSLSEFPGSSFTAIEFHDGSLLVGTSKGLIMIPSENSPPANISHGSVRNIHLDRETAAYSDEQGLYILE